MLLLSLWDTHPSHSHFCWRAGRTSLQLLLVLSLYIVFVTAVVIVNAHYHLVGEQVERLPQGAHHHQVAVLICEFLRSSWFSIIEQESQV